MENENPAGQVPAKKEADTVRGILQKATSPGTMLGLKTNDIKSLFGGYANMIATALPRHLTAERMISLATTTISQNPKIAECTAASIIGSIVQASILGFNPSPALGYCYLVPFRTKQKIMKDGRQVEVWVKDCQFQIGYRGYIQLAFRSNEIKMIYAEVVREGDVFDYTLGLNPTMKHEKKAPEDANITHAYAVVHYKSGGFNFSVLTKSEIEALRMRSPSQKVDEGGRYVPSKKPVGVWLSDYPAMAKAKAVKQLAKFMPLSDEIMTALSHDEATIKDAGIMGEGDFGMMLDEFSDYEIVQDAPDVEEKVNNALAGKKQPQPGKPAEAPADTATQPAANEPEKPAQPNDKQGTLM